MFLFLSRGLVQEGRDRPGQMDQTSQPEVDQRDRRGLELQEVTNAMVRIYKEQFGRGPTKARSEYAGPDLLVATIEDSLTPAEHTLLALGEHQRVRETRLFFQHAYEQYFVTTVQEITGRTVRAFVSGTDTAQDVSTEVFYFEPAP